MEREYSDLSAEEVRAFMAERPEGSYQLLDVRFEEEYVEEHLPGSILITLDQLEERMEELAPDKDVIVYCLSGKRSVAASVFIGSSGKFHGNIYNMLGGILTWKDMCLPDMPQVRVFDTSGNDSELLYQAMNLEKGADKFYQQVVNKFSNAPYIDAIESLVKAEVVHAKMIYAHWVKATDNPPTFDEVYQQLPGDILEGGKDIDELMVQLELMEESCVEILEMAMMIEYAAYDLYRNMAHVLRETRLEEPFMSLSQSEKSHMRIAAEALALCKG